MYHPRTPNYVLNSNHTIYRGPMDTLTLEAGSFIRPMETTYVPKHVIDRKENKFFNSELNTYCYTYYGIVAIPKDLIREA